MILTYIGENEEKFEGNKEYFCIEVYIGRKGEKEYRMIVQDRIEVHNGRDFEIINNSLDNMVFIPDTLKNEKHIFRLSKLQLLEENSQYENGVWETYDAGDSKLEELIHRIIIEQANLEGFDIEKIEVT